LADPIPNLYEKYGGSPLLTKVVREITTVMLTKASLRRIFEGKSTHEVLTLNVELIALALGHTTSKHNPELPMLGYAALNLSLQSYEEVIGMIRHSLLANGLQSRDATIAINVIDLHAKTHLNVPITRHVTSPFSGVDRRRTARKPE
jgi:hypothetical protein